MKMAIQYFRNRGSASRNRFLSFHNAYHGDTTGAMSLCDPRRSMHAAFSRCVVGANLFRTSDHGATTASL